MCPLLLEEQQSHLQMNIVVDYEASDEGGEYAKRERWLHVNPSGHAAREGTPFLNLSGDYGGHRRDDRGVRSGGTGRGKANTVSTISKEGSVARSN